MSYERTYFRNKKTGRYAHLTDRMVGYTPHQRLDILLEADVLEEVVDKSYRKTGEILERRAKGTGVSCQTVLNLIRKFGPEQIKVKDAPKVKKEFLYCTSKPMKSMLHTMRRALKHLNKGWFMCKKAVLRSGKTAIDGWQEMFHLSRWDKFKNALGYHLGCNPCA